MRRVLVFAILIVLLSLAAGPAAATPQHRVGGPMAGHPGAAAMAGFSPLGARLSATVTVSGTVYDSYHAVSPNVTVAWWSSNGSGSTLTDAGGAYSVSANAGTDAGVCAYIGNDRYLALRGLTWSEGSSYPGMDIYPGRIDVTANRGGPWGTFDQLWVYLWNSSRDCRGVLYAADANANPAQGSIDILDGIYTTGNAYFFWDEGVEIAGSWDVASGATCGTPITVNEAEAQRVRLTSSWWSGKPGVTVKVARDNFPAGWIDAVSGFTEDQDNPAAMTYPNWTSSGSATEMMSLMIPKTASPGHSYRLDFAHQNGQATLSLREYYQVCTIKPSKTLIRRGTRIRATGVVPIQGHYGTTPGTPKTVTLYRHKGTAGVPKNWNPRSQGWVKVCSAKTNGLGAYKTPYFKPSSTQTLVVRYPADGEYWQGYTSTAKVKVR